MAVAHDAASESHTGTTGSASEASFTWDHGGGTPRGVVVFVATVAAGSDDTAKDTGVTYGGVAMQQLNAWAADTSTEPCAVRAYFLGENVPTGTQAIVVNRVNDASVMYAAAASVTAGDDTWVPPTWVLLQNDGTIAEQSVSDTGLTGANALRYAFGWSGLGGAADPTAGANSTQLALIDLGTNGIGFAVETTPGTGSRSVGFTEGSSDDRAIIHLVVEEKIADTVYHEFTSESHLGSAESVSEASFGWTHPGSSPNGVIVCVVTRANATAVDTAVSYGGVAMTLISALSTSDAAGEPGRIQVWHLGASIPSGPQTVTVTRTNNANPAFALCTTVRADRDTELDTAGAVLLSGDGTNAEQSVSDTAGRGNSLRYCMGWGGGTPSAVTPGANSMIVKDHGLSLSGAQVACERVPGTGSRSVGVVRGVSDDRAYAHFAIQQVAAPPPYSAIRPYAQLIVQ